MDLTPDWSSTIANLFMEELEMEVIAGLDYIPHFYKRYVDDFILFILENKIDYTHQVLYSFLHRLQFTIERQKKYSIYFLDINLKDEASQIETDWLTMKVWLQRLLNLNRTPLLTTEKRCN